VMMMMMMMMMKKYGKNGLLMSERCRLNMQ